MVSTVHHPQEKATKHCKSKFNRLSLNFSILSTQPANLKTLSNYRLLGTSVSATGFPQFPYTPKVYFFNPLYSRIGYPQYAPMSDPLHNPTL
jgi:hypothetical protein